MRETMIDSLIEEVKVLQICVAQLEIGQQVDRAADDRNLDVVAATRGDHICITNRVKKPAN